MANGWRIAFGGSAIVLAVAGVAGYMHVRDTRQHDTKLASSFLSYEGGKTRAIEPSVAANERGEVVVAWMRVQGGGEPAAADAIGVRFSRDEGDAFGPIQLVRSPGGRFAADPALAVLPDGSFVLTWLGFRADLAKHGDPYDMRVFAAKAKAGSSRFDDPVLVTTDEADHEYDRPWSTVTSDGRVVVAYRSGAKGKAGITVATSTDARTWERKELFSEFNFGGGLATACAEGKRVYVAYFDPIKGIVLRSSDDFTRAVVVSAKGENVALEAPSCVAASDEVIVAYGIGAGPVDTASSAVLTNVALARSLDAGRTFDARAYVSEPGKKLLHPRVLAGPSGVAVATYTMAGEVRLLRGGFGTASASAVLRGDIRVAPRRDDPAWAGDYLGFWARQEGDTARAYVAYVDPGAGIPQVAFMVSSL